MSDFTWASDAFTLRVAATLLHFFWQGFIVALVVLTASRLLRKSTARIRYSVNVAALLLMVACLPVTFVLVGNSGGLEPVSDMVASINFTGNDTEDAQSRDVVVDGSVDVDHSTAGIELAAVTSSDPNSEAALLATDDVQNTGSSVVNADLDAGADGSVALAWTRPFAVFVTWGYFAGVLLMTARLAVGLHGGQSLRSLSTPIDDAGLLAMVREQAAKVGLRCAPAMAFCEQISIPIVIGVVRPVILLPATLVSGLSSDQLQALITHELSHIRRYDLLVNLLQRIIEAVLFFHPAVWFVSRRISRERENVADDAVLAAGWPPVRYADALVRMAELSSTLRHSSLAIQVSALAASGSSSSEFKRRVLRLLDNSPTPHFRLTRGGIVAMLLVTACLLMTPVVVQSLADGAKARVIDGFVTGPSGAIPGVKVAVILSVALDGQQSVFGFNMGKTLKELAYTTDATKSAYRANWRRIQSCRSV